MEQLQIVDKREVLGVDFKIYGDFENPLFLAKDVAEWIDYAYKDKVKGTRNVNMMLSTVDEEEKLVARLFTSGQNREMWFLTEDGLYEVLMQSRKPIAKQFKKQVKTILKELRKGNIELSSKLSEKDNAILNIVYAKSDLDKALAVREFEQVVTKPLIETIELQDKKIKEDKPKVDIANKRLLKNGCYSITEVTKSLGLKRGQVTKWAKEQGYIHKKIIEVNNKGEDCFKIYDNGGFKCIGITEEGLKLINSNLDKIKDI